jgi:hypothetical protein
VTTVILATVRMLQFLDAGGHFWAYMQYAQGLRELGCDVYLFDTSWFGTSSPNRVRVEANRRGVDGFYDRLSRYGLRDKAILAVEPGKHAGNAQREEYVRVGGRDVADVFASADLLLNFNYRLSQEVVSAFRRSALVDIDPGLLQSWISQGKMSPATHDAYFTIGEGVGRWDRPGSDRDWITIRPAVCLELWPSTYRPDATAFTTVSSWWGGGHVGTKESYYDNSKRVSYLRFLELPERTDQALELALYLADSDAADRRLLEGRGWRVRHSREVAGSPEAYRRYIQGSRGEFSCAKPSCARFANAWVSDRSLCYLASGKPVVVQDTGPSSYLPDGEGLFRFRTIEDAARAFEVINGDYERQCRLARALAEEHFDAKAVTRTILERAL